MAPAALLFILWFMTPVWAPLVIQRQLPAGWSLEQAQVQRPGLDQIAIPQMNLSATLAGLDVRLRAEGIVLRYRGLALELDTLDVDTELKLADSAPPTRPLELALPRLALPADLPSLRIGTLQARLGGDVSQQQWRLNDLVIDGALEETVLNFGVEDPPYLLAPLSVELLLGGERIVARVKAAGSDTTLLHFEQVPGLALPDDDPNRLARRAADTDLEARAPQPATAQLALALDLALLDPASLRAPLSDAGLPGLREASGTIRVDLVFADAHADAGVTVQANAPNDAPADTDALRLKQGAIELDAVTADFGDLRVDLALATRGQRGARHNSANQEEIWRFETTTMALSLIDEGPAILSRIEELLTSAGLSLPLATPLSLALSLPDPEPDHEPHRLDLEVAEGPSRSWQASSDVLTFELGAADRLMARLGISDLAVQGSSLDEPQALNGGATVRADVTLGDGLTIDVPPLALGASAASLNINGRLTRAAGAGPRFQGTLEEMQLSKFTLQHPTSTVVFDALSVGGTLDGTREAFVWQGRADAERLITAPAEQVGANSLLTADGAVFEGTARHAGATTTVTGTGRLEGLLLPDLAVSMGAVAYTLHSLTLPDVDADFDALTTGLTATIDDTIHEGFELDLDGTLKDGSSVRGEGTVLLGLYGALPFGFVGDLDSAALQLQLDDAALPANAFANAARSLAITLPRNLDFSEGALVLNGAVTLDTSGLDGDIEARGDALGFSLGASQFEGLDFTTRVSLADVIAGEGPLVLRLAQLAAGLDLVSLTTTVDFSGAEFGLVGLDARLLGGTLSSPLLQVSAGELNDSLVRWDGFDLGALFRFLDVNGLEGEGTLDATLPLASEAGQPSIEGARFAARGPGRLRYDSGVPATNIGLQALENFEYDRLEGTLDYAPNGDYTISLDLLGKNPELYGGHPIRFRLNLGGVMPALFRSLFVTGDFGEAIIERLRSNDPEFAPSVPTDDPDE